MRVKVDVAYLEANCMDWLQRNSVVAFVVLLGDIPTPRVQYVDVVSTRGTRIGVVWSLPEVRVIVPGEAAVVTGLAIPALLQHHDKRYQKLLSGQIVPPVEYRSFFPLLC